MKRVITIVVSGLLIAYPVLIYLGMTAFSPMVLAAFVLLLLLLRLAVIWKNLSWKTISPLLPVSMATAVPAVISLLFNSERALLMTPVCINLVLLGTFGWTLFKGPNMIARFAALSEPVITDEVLEYCKKVTVLWCGFFFGNASISAYTVFFTSKELWTLYNGLITYVFMGLLFAGEIWVRKRKMKKESK